MGRLLRQWAPHRRVLGLTATAAPGVRQAICDTLAIPPEHMVLDCRLPPHLRLAVSRLPAGTVQPAAWQPECQTKVANKLAVTMM